MLLAGREDLPGDRLAVEPGADLHASELGVAYQFSDGIRTARVLASQPASRDIGPSSCERVTSRRSTS